MTPGAGARAGQFYPKADTPVPDSELRALAAASERVSEDRARDIAFGAGLPDTEVQRLATGTFHEVFRLEKAGRSPLVLKVTRIVPPGDGLAVEAAVTAAVAAAGIPVVRVLHTGGDAEQRWSVSEFAEGDSMRSIDADEDAVVTTAALLARHLRALHAIPYVGWGLLDGPSAEPTASSWSDYLLRRSGEHLALIAGSGSIDDETAAAAAAVFERAAALDPGPPALLHGDIGPHNAMLSAQGIRLLDWEDALAGDPAFEVAMWATFQPPRRWAAFFDAYYSPGWQPDFRFWAYFLRISVAKAVVRARFGYLDVPGREPAAARVPRALAAIAALDERRG